MKKSLRTVMLGLAFVLVYTVGAWAYPVGADDFVTITGGLRVSNAEGGEFIVTNNATGAAFRTFCLERNEYLSLHAPFKVGGISDSAVAGGTGGAVNGADPISNATKWLFWQYSLRVLDDMGLGFSYSAIGADSVQRAIWFLEEEMTLAEIAGDTLALALINESILNSDGFAEDVAVINLEFTNGVRAQDLLVCTLPTPEPSTLLLLGGGLVGLGWYGRRRMKA